MELTWTALTVDARDPVACARWWAETLGWRAPGDDPAGVEVVPPDGRGPSLFFVPAAHDKAGRNRLHLDLRAPDQASAVVELETRGARRADIGQPSDAGWVVLRDPEGNEFCLLEPVAVAETSSFRCSFCHLDKPRQQICAGSTPGLFICLDCADLAAEVIRTGSGT